MNVADFEEPDIKKVYKSNFKTHDFNEMRGALPGLFPAGEKKAIIPLGQGLQSIEHQI